MSDQQKLFCGNGRDFHFDNGGQSLGLTIDLTALGEAVRAGHAFEYNGRKYIKLKAVQMREPNQMGKTHYVEVDTYKPNQQSAPPQNGHNQYGSMAQGGPPPQQSQGYNAGSNPQGYNSYSPPSAPAQEYTDDIPF